ncbi:DUF2589 domain-containing protein [Gallaecimonas sp. GXIMD4217]|uniref:DUF2589 domain-containing protein n=1 Tax=Gallaecimonas sp. GXIMD4217 TaxID=3131927 RepID=UPI00311B2B14
MAVEGRELASLDFGNLIGGPLNAVVESQAKSAITTANFIKEVGFDKDGKIVNVDFSYNRKDDQGRDQEFTLTVPFLTMLPIPYITVDSAEIEFNAKITSTKESNMSSNFTQQVDASAGGSWWFAKASIKSKTSYQRQRSTTEKEERTFDMKVKVQARNADTPAGTERLLTILENTIEEKGGSVLSVSGVVTVYDAATDKKVVTLSNVSGIKVDWHLFINGTDVGEISAVDEAKKQITLKADPNDDINVSDDFECKKV